MSLGLGVLIGWLSMYLFGIGKRYWKEKKGVNYKKYEKLPFTSRLKDTIRHIIFEYDIKRKNNDFLLNIKLDNHHIMQIMHRVHFPELCHSESDLNFGLALYIPVNELPESNRKMLEKIITEELETLHNGKNHKLEYYVVDLGKRVRFSGYLLSRILKEVFEAEEDQYDAELFSEGNLPYGLN